MADGLLVERLRQYLKDLHPDARALLMAEIERGLLRGDDMPGAELVLQELRRDARDMPRAKRPGNLARLFFQPLEPFLVDDTAAHQHPGRIARETLDPVWDWIGRDLMPGEAKAVTEQVAAAFERGEVERAEQLAAGFQDRTVTRIEEALNAAANDEKIRRRLAAQIGTQHALEDATAVMTVLKARHALATFGARLPGHIKVLDGAMTGDVKTLIDSPAAGGPRLFLYALVMTMSRLASPWQLIRLATRAAGSDSVTRISETKYSVAVEIVFAEIERMTGELKAELRSGRGLATGALLKGIHDAARGMRTEIDLTHDSPWSRRLAALRTQVADLLKGEIEGLNGRVRRLLRPRPTKEIAPNSSVDSGEVQDTEALIEFVGACRAYASELAVNELTSRAWSELEQYLDPTTKSLVENLRNAGPADHSFRQSQLDAAVRFCAKVFGEEYAQVLVKARDAAAGCERKVAAKA
jgi:hypothetical protein